MLCDVRYFLFWYSVAVSPHFGLSWLKTVAGSDSGPLIKQHGAQDSVTQLNGYIIYTVYLVQESRWQGLLRSAFDASYPNPNPNPNPSLFFTFGREKEACLSTLLANHKEKPNLGVVSSRRSLLGINSYNHHVLPLNKCTTPLCPPCPSTSVEAQTGGTRGESKELLIACPIQANLTRSFPTKRRLHPFICVLILCRDHHNETRSSGP